MTLDELPTDRTARVQTVASRTDPVMLRLMEMGLVVGTPVMVRKRGPLGGPLELRVRDYILTIRRAEARRFTVEVVEQP